MLLRSNYYAIQPNLYSIARITGHVAIIRLFLSEGRGALSVDIYIFSLLLVLKFKLPTPSVNPDLKKLIDSYS